MELPQVGDVIEGTVVRVYPHYAILLTSDGLTALLHISEISHRFIRNFTKLVNVGNIYQAKVIDVDDKSQNIKVSLKQMSQDDRNKSLSKKSIPECEIDFTDLKDHLPDWIKAENALGDKNDD